MQAYAGKSNVDIINLLKHSNSNTPSNFKQK